jgi:hypothetical protein
MQKAAKHLIVALSAALTLPAAGAGDPEGAGAATQGTQLISPQRVDIRVDVRPELPIMLVEADLTFKVNEPAESVRVFLRPDMSLDLIEDADGVPLTYRRRRTSVRVTTPSLERGTEITWTFRYRARFDAPLEESGQILLTTPWYPYFRVTPDPEEFQRYEPMAMTLTADLPQPWVLVSAGTNRVTRNEDGTINYRWSDSVPSSQISLAIGRFVQRDKLEQVGALRGFFAPRHESLMESYVEYMGTAATFFTERIGRLNRRSWNLVALELPDNISGVTVPGVTLLEDREVTLSGAFPYRVLAHEIAHHWWNHYIEIPRARDAWLREGLPTYSSLLFLEHEYGNQLMRRELARSQRVALSANSGETLDMGFEMETSEAIYALNYHKAAAVLHMLREVMGLDGFTRLFRDLHALRGDVTTEVFIAKAEGIYGEDLSWFFDAWLRSAAVPSFNLRYSYRQTNGTSRYELVGTIEQTGATIRYPVVLRIALEAAPPLETEVWIEPGITEFSIVLPSSPRDLQFDPYGDLLYRTVTIEPSGREDAR